MAALRGTGSGGLGWRRWLLGLVLIALGFAMTDWARAVEGDGQYVIAMFVAEPIVVGAAVLSPAFAGRLAALLELPLRRVTAASGQLAASWCVSPGAARRPR